MRAKLGFGLLYVVAIAIILGGLGDLVIREPLEVHRRFLLGGLFLVSGRRLSIDPTARRSRYQYSLVSVELEEIPAEDGSGRYQCVPSLGLVYFT
jgi:hypothetical protein